MDPSKGKTARTHVLPGSMREQSGGEENAGFDEILLSPDRLAGLVDTNARDVNNLKISHRHQREATDYNGSDEAHHQGKIQRVLPAMEDENILKSSNDSLEVEEEQKQKGKLPPVRLQRVRSEDLSWLDTIIYTTTTPTVKQQRGDSVRSDEESGCL